MTRAEIKVYATASVATAERTLFCFLKTLAMMSKLLEYRRNLKARNTLRVLNRRTNFSSLSPPLRTVMDGKMEIRSIIASGVMG